jgi:hypothetical protein
MARSYPLFTAALAAALIASATPARADEATDLAAAQVFLEDGNRAAAAGDFAAALERYRAGYARYRSTPILLNIATALRRLGRNAEAGSAYEDYLRDPRANPERIPEVQRALGEIDLTVGRVALGASDPAARLYLDGAELVGFHSGATLRVEPGGHTFLALGAGVPPMTQVVRIGPRESRVVYFNLPVAYAPSPDAPGVEPREPTPGPRLGPRPERVVSAVVLTLGALGTATGIGLGIAAFSINLSSGDHCLGRGTACDPRGVELQHQARDYARAADITLGSGLGVLLVGAILRIADPSFRSSGALPLASHVGANVTKSGSFLTLEATW